MKVADSHCAQFAEAELSRILELCVMTAGPATPKLASIP